MSPGVVQETVRREGFRGRFFCGVEACHKGSIPVSCVVGALFIDRRDPSRFARCDYPVACMADELEAFCRTLPQPPPEHPPERALRLGKQRHQVEPS
jgi:hypothetical protein